MRSAITSKLPDVCASPELQAVAESANMTNKQVSIKGTRNVADINYVNRAGGSAIHYVVAFSTAQGCKVLIDHGANISSNSY